MGTEQLSNPESKPGKGQFKCFQCRRIFSMKDGDWYFWNTMEVHLCISCERTTRDHTERKKN
jgi:hypothetical protein